MKVYSHLLVILLLLPASSWGFTRSIDDHHSVPSVEELSVRQDSFIFSREIYDRIKADKNFYYEDDPVLKKNLLYDIQLWLAEKLGGLMRVSSGRWFDGLMLMLFTLLFLVAVYILFRSNPGGIFYSETQNSKVYTGTDSIEKVRTYESELDHAIAGGNWRNAVRYIYLITLEKFVKQGIIHYKPEKSPLDYQKELDKHIHAHAFGKLVYVYTYVWYGNFSIDAEAFYALQKLLQATYIKDTKL
ncbi:MAG: hypothetical protein JJU28_00655 [Cyclobacteriaceae bacterium]|nr:hypothetical protein [Cyclobacteriaceae bacterium]